MFPSSKHPAEPGELLLVLKILTSLSVEDDTDCSTSAKCQNPFALFCLFYCAHMKMCIKPVGVNAVYSANTS